MRKKRRIGSLIAIICLAIVAAVCFFYFFGTQVELAGTRSEYKELADEYVEPDPENGLLDIDWNAMLSEYPEIVAWLYLNEDCSYPVVQHDDNSFYLNHSATGAYATSGAIFMNADNSPDFSDRNTVIYGHNMNSGAMFGFNSRYRDEEYTKEHPYFYIYTPDGACTLYEIFSVSEVEDATRPYDVFMKTDAEFSEFIKDITPYRLYMINTSVTSKDSVVSLSTCARHNTLRRLMICGVSRGHITKLPEGESPQE